MMLSVDVHDLMKLGIAAIFGLIIGLEREIRNKPLGLKTSLVICLSSCLLTIVSIESANKYAVPGLHVMDPMRLAAQVVSGIGFLGAGAILRKHNDVIIGLTTAAMIWGAAGLGIAIGAGFIVEAFFGLLLIMVSVVVLPYYIKKRGPRPLLMKDLRVRLVVSHEGNLTTIIKDIIARGYKMKSVHIKELNHELQELNFIVFIDRKYASEVYDELKSMAYIEFAEVETL
ncbi:MgtC/SapB family protein [Paenibacillus aceris]|uniref:Mg2+ transporter-C (MgtC) family protein n=1 Tax=Paenibacillus aceris TaxID=869555 RepID=A0ABS4I309_9BACL|nr:MgtC/SapB family protein [Paenibacillus aceris]MBP1965105.1 putative Mg2+ transporter-C (MgtC) family protein [Paenibacillus aceris]NHW33087.1 MgtC/SapB family protein [Paenibacillus aceris]